MPPDLPAAPPEENSSPEVSVQQGLLREALPRPAPSPWSLTDLGFFAAFVLAWLLISNLLTLSAYAALKTVLGWRTPPAALQNNAFFALTAQMIFYGPVLGYIYHLVVVRYRLRFWTALQWGKLTPQQTLRLFLGGVLLAFAAAYMPPLLPDKETFPLRQLFSSPAAAYGVAAFAILVAPFMEEVIFRGVLFVIFERQAGVWFAIVGTAGLFAVFHVPEYWGAWNHLLLVSLAGVAFSLARGLTSSLASSVVLHAAYNASLMTALFFDTRHFHSFGIMIAA